MKRADDTIYEYAGVFTRGSVSARVYRPVLSEEERAQRMRALYRTAERLLFAREVRGNTDARPDGFPYGKDAEE